MTLRDSTNSGMVEQQAITINLKALAHLRTHGQSSNVVVAGAGIIEALGNKTNDYGLGDSVVVLMQEKQRPENHQVVAYASSTCRIPPDVSFEDAVSMVYPFAIGLAILQNQLTITFPPSSSGSLDKEVPAAVILGGERALAQALTQLLHIALPTTGILVACRAEDTRLPGQTEEAVRPFCGRAVENGAKYAIDAAAPDLVEHLRAATDAYGGPLKLILDVGGEVVRRSEILDLLHEGGKFVDCTQVQFRAEMLGKDGTNELMTSLGKLMVESKLRPPLSTDMYTTTS